ncbi:MAG: arylsulfatase [Xanthomonadales bacterium]|nr:arylsulfatase [Xanthomonadales bacterium]
MSVKSLLKSLLLIGLGILLGYGWFRFGGVIAPAITQQHATTTILDQNLPRLDTEFKGKIGRSYRQSSPYYPQPLTAAPNSPNILIILTDDVGFASSSTFGGPVPTPALDKLAAEGLLYNRFHTTAMCSPTRASMLTGRNAHMVGSGMISNLGTGYPGYSSAIPRSAATIGRILTGNGYNTAFFGKHHNVPDEHSSAAGPFHLWPTGLGFEYFYGFIGGDTDQFYPNLFRGIQAVEPRKESDNFILDKALANDAIRWLRNQSVAAPDKPWMIWYAPGTAHSPHQAPQEWIDKFKGRFDHGWDVVREESHARQKAQGVIPGSAKLTPRPSELQAWDSLTSTQKQISAAYMEVFAATLAFQDDQIGRVIDELRQSGDFDNTLIMFVQGDNGGSAEGGLDGHLNEIGNMANQVEEPESWVLSRLGSMGGPESYQNYPASWAWAMNSPFQWTKAVGSHLGGTRNGLIVSWPAGITATGEVRDQYHHVIDIMPTVLDAAGIEPPEVVDGIVQQRIDGFSMRESFDNPHAPGRQTQYFELYANRAIYQQGWLANTRPVVLPWQQDYSGGDPLSDYSWELYELDNDYSQAMDLASQLPEKLDAMKQLWWETAKSNNVLPLDDRRGAARVWERFLRYWNSGKESVFRGKQVSATWAVAPPLFARDFTITADLSTESSSANGVILAMGSWFGGWNFYLDEGRPVAYHAFSQRPEDQFIVMAEKPFGAGSFQLEFRFEYDGGGIGKGGTMTILGNGDIIAQGRVERTISIPAGLGETMDTGRDTGVPVTSAAAGQTIFEGEIDEVRVRSGKLSLMPF